MFVVTGPTGNIGTELSRRLLQQRPDGLEFRLAAHHPDAVRTEFGANAPVVALDYDDRSTWPEVFEDATTLFVLFPLPKPTTARRWMVPFIQAAAAARVEHIIYVTVPGGDSSRVIPHNLVERAVKGSGMGWTLLRPSYFMQNLVRKVSTHGVDIAQYDEVFIPAGKGTTTFVDSRDLAEVITQIAAAPAEHDGFEYTLTGPVAMNYFQVADILTEVLQRPIAYAHPSFVQFWRRLRKRGVTRDTVLFMCVVYTLARRGRNNPMSDDLPRLLGRPQTSFRQFAEDYAWRWETQTWT